MSEYKIWFIQSEIEELEKSKKQNNDYYKQKKKYCELIIQYSTEIVNLEEEKERNRISEINNEIRKNNDLIRKEKEQEDDDPLDFNFAYDVDITSEKTEPKNVVVPIKTIPIEKPTTRAVSSFINPDDLDFWLITTITDHLK